MLEMIVQHYWSDSAIFTSYLNIIRPYLLIFEMEFSNHLSKIKCSIRKLLLQYVITV